MIIELPCARSLNKKLCDVCQLLLKVVLSHAIRAIRAPTMPAWEVEEGYSMKDLAGEFVGFLRFLDNREMHRVIKKMGCCATQLLRNDVRDQQESLRKPASGPAASRQLNAPPPGISEGKNHLYYDAS